MNTIVSVIPINLEKAVQTAKDAKNAKNAKNAWESEQFDSSQLHLMGGWVAAHIYQILLAFLAPLAVQWIFLGSMQSTLPHWAEWLAQDADGTWWAYEACPNRHDSGWYENELGRCMRLCRDNPNPEWMHSLRQIDAR